MDNEDFTGSGWVEPTDGQREAATFLRGMYLAFVETGFSGKEALEIIAAAMKAQA